MKARRRNSSVALVLLASLVAVSAASADIRAMREIVYRKLGQAQVATEAEDWKKAFELLEDVAKMRDLDGGERAQLHAAYGYTYFLQEKLAESIEHYEKVLAEEEAPAGLVTSTLYTLAQLSFLEEQFERALGFLQRWIAQSTNPGPEPFVLMGQAYFQLDRYREAAEPVERAIAIAELRGQEAQENWYGLLRALYYELEDRPNLRKTLEILCTKFPRREYWVHLAAVHGEMGDERRQLATYEIAFRQGYVSSESELRQFAQLLIQANVPYRAGVILSEGLHSGSIAGTPENWRLLSQAWMLAHEDERAIEALTQAAVMSEDGEFDARLAQCHAHLDDWPNVVTASQNAVRKGVEDAHEMLILMGVALMELGRLDEAKVVFQTAQETPQARQSASRWIEYIESEQARRREMDRSLR